MSLFYSREQMWDLPIEPHDDEKSLTHWMGNISWALVGGLCKLLFRYTVKGKENLLAFKGVSGVVVVCNHTSYLDVAFMYLASRPNDWVRIMGRDTLFDNAGGLSGQILSRTGAFPVTRDTSDRTAIKRAARALKRGENVGILPEGTRRGKGSLEPRLHAGAAFIAKMGGGVPIVPMTVRNAEKIKEKGKRVRFPKVTIEYGAPILLSDFDFMDKGERLEGCTWYALRECFAMFYGKLPQEIDMAALFPKDHDYTQFFSEHPIPAHSAEEVAVQIKTKKDKEQAEKLAKEQSSEHAKKQVGVKSDMQSDVRSDKQADTQADMQTDTKTEDSKED